MAAGQPDREKALGLALAGIVLLGGGAVLLVVRRRHRTATSG